MRAVRRQCCRCRISVGRSLRVCRIGQAGGYEYRGVATYIAGALVELLQVDSEMKLLALLSQQRMNTIEEDYIVRV